MARTHDRKARIEQMVSELALAKDELDSATAAYKAKQEEAEALLAPTRTTRDEKAKRVAELREQIQTEGLLVEKEELHPALILKEVTDIQYDRAAMFQWCVTFNPALLELRDSNITQYVNWILARKGQTDKFFGTPDGTRPLIPMPVTVQKVATIQFVNDLSSWIPVVEDEAIVDQEMAEEQAAREPTVTYHPEYTPAEPVEGGEANTES